jgi:cyclohexanecarboxylate-CoA ligase
MSGALPIGSSWWDLIERRAARTSASPMLLDEAGRTITYGRFRSLAEEVAAGLTDRGVRPGQVVSWQLPSSLEAVVLMAALARLGVAQNPVIPILRRSEVGLITQQLASAWLVVPGTWRGFDYVAMAEEATAGRACEILATSDFDGEVSLPTGDPSTLPPPTAAHGEVRWYFYSSGTTAAPKGARHTDVSCMAASTAMIEQIRLRPDDVFPVAFPIAHIGGIMTLTAVLRAAAAMMLIEAFDPVRSPVVMAENGATLLGSAVPFFLAYLDAQRRHGDAPLFPKLRQLIAGGAPVPPELHFECQRVLGAGIVNQWGLTEFPAATGLDIDDPDQKFAGTVGRPVSGVEVRAVGTDGQRQAAGTEGELCVRGPQCFLGYVDESLDADAFDGDGFFRTGDLGVIDADGFVRITGRLKDVIIRNAENISAVEIEEVLYRHPSILDVAVIGVPDARTGERCCAVVVLAPGVDTLLLADLAEHCRSEGLANQKIPEQLELVSELPRNTMGKVLKHVLRHGR